METVDLSAHLTDVADFPEPGIVFKDISPLLASPDAFAAAVAQMAEPFRNSGVTAVAGIEARGFLFGPGIAQQLGAGFVMVRKPGKLPGELTGLDYELEYGTDRVELIAGAIDANDNVLVVDDVLATGGTLHAAAALVRETGAKVVGASVLVELVQLNGRNKLPDTPIHAPIEVN